MTDSPIDSVPNTIEHVESSCAAVYSLDESSSEDLELLEAQAIAAQAVLRLAEAKNKKKLSFARGTSERFSFCRSPSRPTHGIYSRTRS